ASLNESEASDKRNFTLAIITNKDADSKEIIARIQDENAATFNEVPLKMSWPDGIYSLSHLAIPFPMDDPLYGTDSVKPHSRHIQLGSINMRGERTCSEFPKKISCVFAATHFGTTSQIVSKKSLPRRGNRGLPLKPLGWTGPDLL
ncbi:MAG: hypothetical protein ACYTBW_03480, partial [Planctomycetota bacterium]